MLTRHSLAALTLTLLSLAAPARAQTVDVETHTIRGRECRLAMPSSRPAGAPLLVILHGCTQDPAQISRGTVMDRIATERGWYVLYPTQTSSANQNKCWNWFLQEHQARGSGEPALLAGIVEEVVRQHRLDFERVYVAGISAGAAMSVILGATYPDVFAAIGVVAGLEYRAATAMADAWTAMSNGGPSPDAQGALAFRAMGPRARVVPAIVFHGTGDRTVAPKNGEQVVAQWAQTNDLALDGGQDDDDVTPHAARTTSSTATGGRAYTERDVLGPDGRVLIRHVVVDGMGHAWPGGDASGSYTDPSGPPASRMICDFFALHTRSGSAVTPTPTPTPIVLPVVPMVPVVPAPTPTPTPTPTPVTGARSTVVVARGAEDGTVGRFRAHGLDAGRPSAGDRGMFGGETDRAVLSFDGAALPANAIVTGVRLRLRRARVDGRVDAVLVDVQPGALGLSPALEQTDFDAKVARSAVARFTPPAKDGEWVEIDLPLDVAAGPVQMRLRAVTPTGFDANRLVLDGGEDGALGPQLVVTWRP